jgi:hypothetical protein
MDSVVFTKTKGAADLTVAPEFVCRFFPEGLPDLRVGNSKSGVIESVVIDREGGLVLVKIFFWSDPKDWGKCFSTFMIVLGILWTWSPTRSAEATVYDYGVGLSQGYSLNTPADNPSSGNYCFPTANCFNASPTNGTISVSHSQSKSITGSYGQSPPTVGSSSADNTAKVDLGVIHLTSSASVTDYATATAVSYGFWSDVLTIGNNFAPGTHLKFLLNLMLTGSVSATSARLATEGIFPSGGGSNAGAEAISSLSVFDNYGNGTSNIQTICTQSFAGKNTTCSGTIGSPNDFAYVLSTYPGAKVSVHDELYTSSTADGQTWGDYPCGKSTCISYASASADSYFLNTSSFTLSPITKGAFYTSSSGVSYLGSQNAVSMTPEASTWILFLTGIMGIGIWSWNKSSWNAL